MTLRSLIDAFRQLPVKVGDLDHSIRGALELARDLSRITDNFVRIINRQNEPPATFVYVLPPDGAPMFCCRQHIERGTSMTVTFDTQIPIPVGAWIVSTGPAVVRGVVLGNQWQICGHDYQGQVSKTTEAWTPGTHLRVELAA